jgi:uncharacterized protein YoxC
MKTLLIVLTLAEVAILVIVLAAYLVAIAATLRKVSHTLGLVTFGVRAIEKQTEPIGPVAPSRHRPEIGRHPERPAPR